MQLKLQFGYGMMDHSRVLIDTWKGGSVILSPRDLSPVQLERLAGQITSLQGGEVLLDPQFYLPYADHERLTSHEYWPSAYSTDVFWTGSEIRGLMKKLVDLNRSLGCKTLILPGLYTEQVDEDWIARQSAFIEEAKALSSNPLLVTVALGADAVKSDESIDEILAASEGWDVSGIYLLCEHPNGEYLVTDPNWLANALDLVAGLKLKGKKVLAGYCNHQMLVLAAAGVDWIASGTWMNVRSFPPDKFRAPYDDEIKQRSTWYYCPQAFSEYKVPFLDIAKKQGLLDRLAPPVALGSVHADVLFSGIQPTSARWTEQSAFRHYLHCLWSQTNSARHGTFDQTVDEHERALDAAEGLLASLQAVGVRGQLRDFSSALDVNRAALSVLRSSRGPTLRRKWATL
ncbi:hypothetical protein [Nannocystis punicea]|uniref:Uncharacterized protein n=1 Tax=Nannocystis punicea TaxID=2995304 RepID=A0ABY7GXA2_9BACT|nr:hypothetical protein [Nannocystis poenicansa]WAS91563.1 hypothetical protein O0S08_35735 [Nannocystis poenicansa]